MKITIAGVDLNVYRLTRALEDYRHLDVEAAVLANVATWNPRWRTPADRPFPSYEHFREFEAALRLSGVPAAVHLHGHYAGLVTRGEHRRVLALTASFARIQVHAPRPDYRMLEKLRKTSGADVIAAIGRGTGQVFTGRPPSTEIGYLFHTSDNTSTDPIREWKAPWEGVPCGYAGEVNADNIRDAMRRLHALGADDAWIEIGRGARDEHGALYVDRIRRILDQVSDGQQTGRETGRTP